MLLAAVHRDPVEQVAGPGDRRVERGVPGCMEVREGACEDECEYRAVTASAQDLRAGLVA